jgi:hypothetical protein
MKKIKIRFSTYIYVPFLAPGFAFRKIRNRIQQPNFQRIDADPDPEKAVFLNIYGDQESIPRNRFHQGCRTGPPG